MVPNVAPQGRQGSARPEQHGLRAVPEVAAHSHLRFHPRDRGLVLKSPRAHYVQSIAEVAICRPEIQMSVTCSMLGNHRQPAQFRRAHRLIVILSGSTTSAILIPPRRIGDDSPELRHCAVTARRARCAATRHAPEHQTPRGPRFGLGTTRPHRPHRLSKPVTSTAFSPSM